MYYFRMEDISDYSSGNQTVEYFDAADDWQRRQNVSVVLI